MIPLGTNRVVEPPGYMPSCSEVNVKAGADQLRDVDDEIRVGNWLFNDRLDESG